MNMHLNTFILLKIENNKKIISDYCLFALIYYSCHMNSAKSVGKKKKKKARRKRVNPKRKPNGH